MTTDRETDGQTDRQTGRQTDRQTAALKVHNNASLIIIIIIIIIIILVITFVQCIYNYIPETNHVPRVHTIASALYLRLM